MKQLVTFSRIFVGVLFIISGLIKSNDTIGFAYKLEEYYQVFGTEFLISTAVLQAMFICIIEVMLGFLLLLGSRVKFTLYLLMAMIVFFTFLTFYSAYFNKVTDCGCFGDALKLSPWGSFTKDVVLLFFISILLIGQKYIKPVFNKKFTEFILLIALLLNIAFPVYTYNYMPVIDFRPYKIGADILEGLKTIKPPVYDTKFVFKNNETGKEEELNKWPYIDTINWETDTVKWTFIDTKSILTDPGIPAPIHDFSISSLEGSDYTTDILGHEGYHFFLVAYDLNKADKSVQPAINELAQACEKQNIPFIALTASSTTLIDEFRHEVQALYPFYITDGTQLKTMIRSNPGLMLMKGSKVIDMWHHNNFPSFEQVRKKHGV